jgi:hypothetical protein
MKDDNGDELKVGDNVACYPNFGNDKDIFLGHHLAKVIEGTDGKLILYTSSAFSGRPVELIREQWKIYKV